MDDEFKVKTSEYSSVKGQLNVISRKAAGSLATRDIGQGLSEWDRFSGYGKICDTLRVRFQSFPERMDRELRNTHLAQFVVPRSSTLLMEDGDYALYTVTLFRRVVDAFKSVAAEKAFK